MDLKRQRLVVGFVAALGNNSLGVVVDAGEKMHQKTPHRRPFYFVSSLGLIVGQLSCLWLTLASLGSEDRNAREPPSAGR